jgi:putative holliday junction resolvase
MRYLAIDLGLRRTGLAVGDDVAAIVTPLSVIVTSHAGERMRGIAREIDRHGPAALVLGLPLNMDGTDGPAAIAVREFALTLAKETALPVHLADERLSSVAADAQMAQSGMTHSQKKSRRDALAAADILKRFIDSLPHRRKVVAPDVSVPLTGEPEPHPAAE